jgi:LysM repeat protein
MSSIKVLAAVTALGVLVAGCGGQGGVRTPSAVPAPAADEASVIDGLLLRGEIRAAQKRIKAALKRDPLDPSVRLLRDSIEREPVELLGPNSFEHVVRPGETISSLAQQFLGNRLKAYQLGRYNGLSAPFDLRPGQTVRIPGTEQRVQPARRVPVPPRAAPQPGPSAPAKPATAPTPAPAKPAVAAPAANPAAAQKLRIAGLAALNQGKVLQAVGLLQRAAAADPANPVIARDLARARRIAATVQARR